MSVMGQPSGRIRSTLSIRARGEDQQSGAENMARWVAGVDGCKGGWIVALRNLDAPGRITVGVEPDIGAVLRRPEEPRVVAIDMPIGLPRRVGQGGRRAEQEVRRILGPKRASVFPTSARDVVYARTWDDVVRLVRTAGVQPFLPSPLGRALFPKIRQIDQVLRDRPELRGRIFEVHPEIAFWTMNGEGPGLASKKTKEGAAARRRLLADHGVPTEVASAAPPRGAAADDWLDALAALVVAEHLARGAGRPFPDPPEADDHGV